MQWNANMHTGVKTYTEHFYKQAYRKTSTTLLPESSNEI